VKKFLLPLLYLLLTACAADNQQEKPAQLLPKEKMISTLVDIHIAESKVMQRNLPADSAGMLFRNYKMEIFKKAGVSSEAFEKSYQYYLNNTKEMDAIYAIVVDSLSLRESKGNMNY
jgi:hypothetical protein